MATNTSEFMCLSRTMTGNSDPPKILCCPMWSKTWSAALIVVEHQCCEMYTHFTLTPLKRFLHLDVSIFGASLTGILSFLSARRSFVGLQDESPQGDQSCEEAFYAFPFWP